MAWLIESQKDIDAMLSADHPRLKDMRLSGHSPVVYTRIGDISQRAIDGDDVLEVQLEFFFSELSYRGGIQPETIRIRIGKEPFLLREENRHPDTDELIAPEYKLPSFLQVMQRPVTATITNGADVLSITKATLYQILSECHPVFHRAKVV